MREVEQAARQALREVRATVAGYRQPTLQSELDGARQLLAAAGIDASIERTGEVLPATVDSVLAWTVREGVTNVIRHSRARRCCIRITIEGGNVTTEVINDRGYAHQAHGAPTHAGSGLAGLTDRVAGHGGQLVAGSLDDDRGFRLWVQLPIGSSHTPGSEPRP
jgi:two-component system sensor histidine kinase DesK